MNTILINQMKSLSDPSLPSISNISNILSLVFYEIEHLNWVGLYLCNEEKKECLLGPFQGKVACTRIPYSSGVVGTCATQKETIVVDDVHQFKGHIACDAASQSEIVIPLFNKDQCIAIFDIDSDITHRFDKHMIETLEEVALFLSDLMSVDNICKD